MNWFGPKLKSGEMLVAVSPPVWPAIPIGLYVLGMVLTSTLMAVEAGVEHDTVFRVVLGLMAGLALAMIAGLILAMRWRVALTDRRVLVRDGFLRRDMTEMPRDTIDSATHRDFALEISDGERSIAIKLHPILADRIVALLDKGNAARGRFIGPFVRVLDPAEYVFFKSGGTALLAMSVFTVSLFLVAAGMLLAVASSSLAVISALQVGGLGLAMSALSTSTLAVSDKRWIVTDRRVLAVTGLLYRRIEDLPLNSDTETALDDTALSIRSGDHILMLPLVRAPEKREAARLIREAIEAAKQGGQWRA